MPPTIDFQKFKNPPIYVRALPKKDGLYGSVLTLPLGVLALSAYIKKHCDVEVDVIDFNVPLNKVDSLTIILISLKTIFQSTSRKIHTDVNRCFHTV